MLMIPPPQKTPTLTQIGKRCKLNKSTVYRALTGQGRVSPETVERVQAVARELGYDPARNRAAQRLASQRTDAQPFKNQAIALFLPEGFHRHVYYTRLHAGILTGLAELHYDLLTAQFDMENPRLPRAVLAGEVDALILVGGSPCDIIDAIGNICPPVVTVAHEMPGRACVVPDDEHAAFLAADHLFALGHRSIFHFFSQDAPSPAARRVAGYRKAAKAHRLDPAKAILSLDMPNDLPHPQWIARHLSLALKKFPQLTALIAPNDEDARTLNDALQSRGLIVPADISLVGCDDSTAISDAKGSNMLSTVDMSLYDIGQAAAHTAADISNKLHKQPPRIVLPARFIARQSACPPRSNPT